MNNSAEITCCFTGHRPNKLPWGKNETASECLALKQRIYQSLLDRYNAGYRHFICGMAMGCDTYFAEEVLLLRQEYPDVTLEAAIPCRSQPDRWNRKAKLEYSDLIKQCDKVTVLQEMYTPDCMMRRNRYMVDHSSFLIACYNGTPGGTMNTLLYASRNNVESEIIEIKETSD